ncbi:hypothetical protein ACFQE8_01715 [Salinirubellus sp. GCM10025818]|jgi:hypothetical protein|uniref:hypothetical protein n=1 Tax=Salinirubellus TaxID=2162630 RepID=UPI0030D31E3B
MTGVVVDRPPMNRRALAAIVLAGLVAASGFFLMPVFEWLGVGFLLAFVGISAIEVGCALVVVVSVRSLYPDDYSPEYY